MGYHDSLKLIFQIFTKLFNNIFERIRIFQILRHSKAADFAVEVYFKTITVLLYNAPLNLFVDQ